MRTNLPFNHDWLFIAADVGDETPDSAFESVILPHTNKLFPHHNFDNLEYQFISTYRKRFKLPEPRAGRRIFLDFDAAMIACEVFLNGVKVGEHEGGYTPFSCDLTDYLDEKGENRLVVRLDSRERADIPPFGFVVDYLTFGGIYRDVRLRYVEPLHITNLCVRTANVLAPTADVTLLVTVQNQSPQTQTFTVEASISDTTSDSKQAIPVPGAVTLNPLEETTLTLTETWDRPALWSIDDPHLYRAEVVLRSGAGSSQIDRVDTRFGFREAEFRKDGRFYLNGQPLKLIGLNRHQTYPYFGAAAPARLQRKDAEIIKHELGCNIVRTSHYPQATSFLDHCDQIGLLVFEEIPGWQHIGDRDWQGITLRDVEAMILRDRNHPSIIIWGVRINESQDDEALYRATNDLAHKLDPTRPTGGVRYFLDSQFLEDVFTYNDFSNTIVEPKYVPHLVTEFSGHMFPTKSFDQEERLIEHALRHARIQDKQLGMSNVAGAIGWCAFDYNTHKEFGSGDRICYHGVMDIWRLPKYAAYLYSSQISPSVRPVLQAATIWSMGDRSAGGNDPLVVFSNCDEIDVFIGNDLFGRFQPDRESFPNLPHPPFQVNGLAIFSTWGRRLVDLRVVGYLDGQGVIEQHIESSPIPSALELRPDDAVLDADGMDMTRLVFRIVDRYGNRLPFATQVVSFEIDGPADLIGENPFALVGGQAALYVRARCQPGTVTVRARTPRLPEAVATIELR
ncbi:MAG: glycoside hydrolase family 2 protein [Anaerolineae bacterium]|nr:glycoside hydrolase family 2 protein [Anaerolineae bacterium]